MARLGLLFMHDLFDPLENLIAHWQPGIDARAGLFDKARLQHQSVADDLRLTRGFLEDGEEVARHTHGVCDLMTKSVAQLSSRPPARPQAWLALRTVLSH